eukprot:gene10699-19468_t
MFCFFLIFEAEIDWPTNQPAYYHIDILHHLPTVLLAHRPAGPPSCWPTVLLAHRPAGPPSCWPTVLLAHRPAGPPSCWPTVLLAYWHSNPQAHRPTRSPAFCPM